MTEPRNRIAALQPPGYDRCRVPRPFDLVEQGLAAGGHAAMLRIS
jgi:hypothetical protein